MLSMYHHCPHQEQDVIIISSMYQTGIDNYKYEELYLIGIIIYVVDSDSLETFKNFVYVYS